MCGERLPYWTVLIENTLITAENSIGQYCSRTSERSTEVDLFHDVAGFQSENSILMLVVHQAWVS